jgi:transcriptional regulator with XRE-family HTH domain
VSGWLLIADLTRAPVLDGLLRSPFEWYAGAKPAELEIEEPAYVTVIYEGWRLLGTAIVRAERLLSHADALRTPWWRYATTAPLESHSFLVLSWVTRWFADPPTIEGGSIDVQPYLQRGATTIVSAASWKPPLVSRSTEGELFRDGWLEGSLASHAKRTILEAPNIVAAKTLRAYRMRRSWSQWELGSELGISQGVVSQIENGYRAWTQRERERLLAKDSQGIAQALPRAIWPKSDITELDELSLACVRDGYSAVTASGRRLDRYEPLLQRENDVLRPCRFLLAAPACDLIGLRRLIIDGVESERLVLPGEVPASLIASAMLEDGLLSLAKAVRERPNEFEHFFEGFVGEPMKAARLVASVAELQAAEGTSAFVTQAPDWNKDISSDFGAQHPILRALVLILAECDLSQIRSVTERFEIRLDEAQTLLVYNGEGMHSVPLAHLVCRVLAAAGFPAAGRLSFHEYLSTVIRDGVLAMTSLGVFGSANGRLGLGENLRARLGTSPRRFWTIAERELLRGVIDRVFHEERNHTNEIALRAAGGPK